MRRAHSWAGSVRGARRAPITTVRAATTPLCGGACALAGRWHSRARVGGRCTAQACLGYSIGRSAIGCGPVMENLHTTTDNLHAFALRFRCLLRQHIGNTIGCDWCKQATTGESVGLCTTACSSHAFAYSSTCSLRSGHIWENRSVNPFLRYMYVCLDVCVSRPNYGRRIATA